jgi:O-antigen/teichoic acid export membrane protein
MHGGSDQGPAIDELAGQARSGVLWLTLISALSRGSQMVVTLALAAIFTKSDLGVVALAMSLANTAMVVQVMGVSHVIARTDRDEHVMAGTVLTISLAPSAVLTLLGIFGSSRIAAALGAPAAAPLIATIAIGLPFMSIAWLQMALMHRALDFRRRLVPDAGSAVIGAVVTIGLAVFGVGPMSVATGFVVTAVLQPLFGFLVGVRVRPRWDRGSAREARRWIASVGLGAVVYTFLINVDFPIVSRILGPDSLGLYSLAFRIGWLPYLLLSVVLASVSFPLYSRLIRDNRESELPFAVARFTHVLLVVVGGMYVIIVLLSDRIVLLGERWAPAVPALMVLCAYGLGLSLLTVGYETIIAAGRLRRYLCFETGHLVLLVISLLAFTRCGITAAALAQAASVWTIVAGVWVTMVRAKVAPPARLLARAVLGLLVPSVVCVVIVAVARWADLEPDPRSLVGAALELLVLLVCYAAVGALANRSLLAAIAKRRKVAG